MRSTELKADSGICACTVPPSMNHCMTPGVQLEKALRLTLAGFD